MDPQLEIEPYLEAAGQQSMRITHIVETHVQADHLSGARRLARATGAPVLLHESTGAGFPYVGVEDGEEHEMGNVRMTVLHTPGHTPESVSILVTDRSRAREPWFVLTGDTLFSGGVGRPDLLGYGAETALAEQLYESLHGTLLELPDHIEVYPAHFGGAAGGRELSSSNNRPPGLARTLSGKPGSTIGFERRFNPELRFGSKPEFIRFVLEDLPPQPEAFAENRRRNLGVE